MIGRLGEIDRAAAWRAFVHGLVRYRAVAAALVVLAVIIATSPALEVRTIEQDVAQGAGPTTIVQEGPAAPGSQTRTDGAPATGGGSTTDAGGQNDAADPGDAPLPANCDPATGRIKFPSVYAPPCVRGVSDNGGATYQGVTGTEIRTVLYRAQPDPAVDALIQAAGAADTREDTLQTRKDWHAMFGSIYETYGRRVTLEVFDASGPSDDDAAARADAIDVATRLKPFAVFGGPAPFIDEITNRGILSISQIQRPQDFFADHAPFIWGSQMSSTQAFLLLAEYIGKRLAGDPAVHAGDNAYHGRERTFGLIYLDTAEGVYRPGAEAFERELATYGVELTDRIAYEGDINRAQEQARVIISRLKDAGITTVLFSGDPVAPIFFTQEATNQEWFPEWVIPGGTLVDTNFFGRTYDQAQWSNAFGISQLWIRPPQEQTEPFVQHVWFHGRPPQAQATYEIIYQEPLIFFTALHMAGPTLTPQTFRDGLFAYPPSGSGLFTQLQRSWGRHGFWPFDDYTGFDTVTEVWWDPSATGNDEVGNDGRGLFQFVEGGRRYGPGDFPATPPAVFDPSRSQTSYDALPASDSFPTYERPS